MRTPNCGPSNFSSKHYIFNLLKADISCKQTQTPIQGRQDLKYRPSDRVREKKIKLCAIVDANFVGKKVNCAGNCAGLRNLANIVFSLSTFSLTIST